MVKFKVGVGCVFMCVLEVRDFILIFYEELFYMGFNKDFGGVLLRIDNAVRMIYFLLVVKGFTAGAEWSVDML